LAYDYVLAKLKGIPKRVYITTSIFFNHIIYKSSLFIEFNEVQKPKIRIKR